MTTKSFLVLLTVSAAVFLVSCAGGLVEEADTDMTIQESRYDLCGGACGTTTYNECTCAASDPCGWSEDGACDRKCRDFADEIEIFDDQDCPECAVTMCLTGAVSHSSGSNRGFAALCNDPRIPGHIPDCRGRRCNSTWTNFLHHTRYDLLPGLIEALDTNGDKRVNDHDQVCEVNLVGFSWGGVNAIQLARELMNSPKVAGSRARVHRLIIMDPYQPGRAGAMKVPPNVSMVRNYKHSKPPAANCSGNAPLGPYTGFGLICPSWQSCREYDYSRSPEEWFEVTDGWYQGKNVDHCAVPSVAREAVIANLLDTPSKTKRPRQVPVRTP